MNEDVQDILGSEQKPTEESQEAQPQSNEELDGLKTKVQEYENAIAELRGLFASDEVLRSRLQEIYNGNNSNSTSQPQTTKPSEEEGVEEIEPEKEIIEMKDKVSAIDNEIAIMKRKSQLEELAKADRDFFEDDECLKTMETIVLENPQFEDMPNGAKLAYELAKARMGDKLSAKREVAGDTRKLVKSSGVSLVGNATSGRPEPPQSSQESLRRQFAQMIKERNQSIL